MSYLYPTAKGFSTGQKIYRKVMECHKYLKLLSNRSKINYIQMGQVLTAIEVEMSELFALILEYSQHIDRDKGAMFEMEFSYPEFKKKAALSLILSYNYMMVTAIQKELGYSLITDTRHLNTAYRFMTDNEPLFREYVNS